MRYQWIGLALTLLGLILAGTAAKAGNETGEDHRRDLIVVDATVPDSEQLLDGRHHHHLLRLDEHDDPLEAIAKRVQALGGIRNLHLLSHGEAGAVTLAGRRVDRQSLSAHIDSLETIRHGIAPGGEVLLYGCNVAVSEEGRRFVDQLAAYTGASVAASTTAVGSAALGGNWQLEYRKGEIAAAAPFSDRAMNQYQHVLSHGRGGIINWQRADLNDNGEQTDVFIEVKSGWRSTFISSVSLNTDPALSLAKIDESVIFIGGDDADSADYALQTTIFHAYDVDPNTRYLLKFSLCCRISGLENNASSLQGFEGQIFIQDGNEPPKMEMPIIMEVPQRNADDSTLENWNFRIPSFDPNADTLRYRLARDEEFGGGGQSNPDGVAINPNTGVISWSDSGTRKPGLYSAGFVAEDLDDQGNVKSKTHIDMILALVDKARVEFTADVPETSKIFVDKGTTHTLAFDSTAASIDTQSLGDIQGALSEGAPNTFVFDPGPEGMGLAPGTYPIAFEVRDDSGASANGFEIVNYVVPDPRAPRVTGLEGIRTQYSSTTAELVDPDQQAELSYDEHPDLKDARLKFNVTFVDGEFEVLGVRSDGDGPGEVRLEEGTLYFEGKPIGQVDATLDGTGRPLQIDFTTADATVEAVQAVVRNLTYQDGFELRQVGDRAVSVFIEDRERRSNSSDFFMEITPHPDQPDPGPPHEASNRLTIVEEQRVTLSEEQINYADVEERDIHIDVLSTKRGQFEYAGEPDVAIGGFSQEEVSLGQIAFAYVGDGTRLAPAYTIQASAGDDLADPSEGDVTFSNANLHAPEISGTPDADVMAGQTYSFTPSATDADLDFGDELVFEIDNRPTWTTFDEVTGTLSGGPSNEQEGLYQNIVILVRDQGGLTDSLPAFSIEVTPMAISVSASGEGTVSGGGEVQEGDSVTVSASPDANHRFVEWREDGAAVSGSPDYSFTVEGARELEAVFEPFSTTLTAPAGTAESVNDDGSSTATFVNADGNVTSVSRYSDDASASSITLGGGAGRTSVVQFESGSTDTAINADGSVVSTNTTNGVVTSTRVNADGSIDYEQDGGVMETAPVGSEVHVDAAGGLAQVRADDVVSSSELTEQQCYANDFASGTLPGWTMLESASYTPQIVDTGGGRLNPRLRLTGAGDSQATGITKDIPVPTTGRVEVEFYAHAHGGNGADGIAVVFSDWGDGSLPTRGAPGGALGYAQRNSEAGFSDGWLGIGIDEFGNFSNSNEGKSGGPGFQSNAVSVRGSGNGVEGYEYIAGTSANLRPKIDKNYPGHRYLVVLDTSFEEEVLLTVKRNRGRDISGRTDNFETLIDAVNVSAAPGQASLPERLRLSITGSTGSATNIHEISELRVSAGDCEVVAPPSITTDALETLVLVEGDTGVGTITAVSDSGEALAHFVQGGVDAALFSIDAETGGLAFIDPAEPGVYEVDLAVEDARGNVSEAETFTVQVKAEYTVTTTAAGGDISPASQVVVEGDTAAMVVSPSSGYVLESVSGCDGTLSGDVYTTGVVMADCSVAAEFVRVGASGSGTEQDPWIVTEAAHLAGINQGLDAEAAHYELASDLDLGGQQPWSPIGTEAEPFTGSLRGPEADPAVLTGIEDEPLFGHVGEGAIIEHLVLRGATIDAPDRNRVGLLAGEIVASEQDPARLTNITLEGGSMQGGDQVGGIAGVMEHVKMDAIRSSAAVSGGDRVGGLGGTLADTGVTASRIDGSVQGDRRVGGVGGEALRTTVTDTIVNGDVVATGEEVGGFAGTAGDSHFENVTLNGLVDGDGDRAGGVTGIMTDTSVVNADINGPVNGANEVGGVAGHASGGSIAESIVRRDVTGTGTEVGDFVGTESNVQITDVSVDEAPLDIDLVDSDGVSIGERPVRTGEEIRIPPTGGTAPVTVTGEVTRAGVTQTLVASGSDGVILEDPDTGNPVLRVGDGDYFFETEQGGQFALWFEDAESVTVSAGMDVRATVAFSSARQPGTDGETVELRAILEGIPEAYPVKVAYRVEGHDLLASSDLDVAGELEFHEASQVRSLEMTPMASSSQVRVVLEDSDEPGHALPGNPLEHVVVLRHPSELPLGAQIVATQAGEPLSGVASRDEGPVTLKAIAPGTGELLSEVDHGFDWSESTLALGIHSETGNEVIIDPQQLLAGESYQARLHIAAQDGTMREARVGTRLRIVDAQDGDTVAQWEAFLSASAGDEHHLPVCAQGSGLFRSVAERACSEADRSEAAVFMEAPAGYGLRLGEMSDAASWATGEFGLEVRAEEILDAYGDPARHTSDRPFRHLGFMVDFEVTGLVHPGQSVPVMIPLPEGESIPEEAVWRKYRDNEGWGAFVEDNANAVHSATRSVATGRCPWAGSERWEKGLNPGHECVRLTIEDGGPNDRNGQADGVIRDPGTLAEPIQESTRVLSGSGVGASGLWGLLVLLVMAVLRETRRRGVSLRAVLAMVLVSAGTTAQAAEDRPGYLTLQPGWASTSVSASDVEARLARDGIDASADLGDRDRLGVRFLAGYRLGHWLDLDWSLEGGITWLDEITTDLDINGPTPDADDLTDVVAASGEGAEFMLKGAHALNDQWRAYARAGLWYWRNEVDVKDVGDATSRGTDAVLGLGVVWQWRPDWSARLSWDRYRVERETTHFTGLGVSWHFGAGSGERSRADSAPPPREEIVLAEAPEPEPEPESEPEPTEVETPAVALVPSRVETIRFAVNERNVVEHELARMAPELHHWLERDDRYVVRVTGHTDSTGPAEYNRRLSQQRAREVATLLAAHLDAARIRSDGLGEEAPVADNATEEGRAQNRRVEIRVVADRD